MKAIIWMAGIMAVLTSCKKDPAPVEPDSFSFGRAVGFCQGNCATFYKIQNNSLYPDNIDYYKGEVTYKKEALAEEKFLLVKHLLDSFPAFLENQPGKTYGCPDCYDQGGIHIFYTKKGQSMFWHIDTNISSLPPEIKDYIQRMTDILGQI